MKLPIILRDSTGDLAVYRTPEEAEAHVESPDVEAGEYTVWDAEGRRLAFDVVPPASERGKPTSGKLAVGLSWVAVHPVKLREAADSADPAALRTALLGGLGRFGRHYADPLEQPALEELIEEAAIVFGPRPRRSALGRLCGFALRLGGAGAVALAGARAILATRRGRARERRVATMKRAREADRRAEASARAVIEEVAREALEAGWVELRAKRWRAPFAPSPGAGGTAFELRPVDSRACPVEIVATGDQIDFSVGHAFANYELWFEDEERRLAELRLCLAAVVTGRYEEEWRQEPMPRLVSRRPAPTWTVFEGTFHTDVGPVRFTHQGMEPEGLILHRRYAPYGP